MEEAAFLEIPGWLAGFVAVYVIVWSLVGLALVAGVIYIVMKVKGLSRRARQEMKEVSGKLKQAAEPLTKTADDISGRAKRIAEVVETTVKDVARKVDVTSEALVNPVLNIASFVSGIRKGVAQARAKREGDTESEGEPSD